MGLEAVPVSDDPGVQAVEVIPVGAIVGGGITDGQTGGGARCWPDRSGG